MDRQIMIQDPSKDLTLIVYNTPKPPKYIKINKTLMKTLIFVIPVIVIFSIAFSMISSVYMKRKLEKARSQEPEIILNLRKEKKDLAAAVATLKQTNLTLTQKISQGSGAVSAQGNVGNLMALFTAPLGFEDKRSDELAKLENMTSDTVKDKVLFKFDILNNTAGGNKLAGYITIVQYHRNGLSFYPQYDLSLDSPRLEFSKGESFTVSRFRPVIAEFPKPNGTNVWYKIFIFSRTGNLLAFKKAGPFQFN